MKKYLVQAVFVCVLLAEFPASAQFPSSVESLASAGGSLFAVSACGTAFGNPATLDSAASFSGGFYTSQGFLVAELQEKGVGINIRVMRQTKLHASFAQKGYSLFSYQRGAVFLSQSFGKGLAAAVGAEMRSVRQGEGYGSLTAWNVKSALKIRVSHKVEAATMLTIPVKKAWMVAKNDFLFGLRYRFSSVFSLCAEAGLYDGETPFRFYLRYHAAKKVIIYGGAGGRPFRMAFGCSLHWRSWQILTGAAYQPVTGFTPGIELDFQQELKD